MQEDTVNPSYRTSLSAIATQIQAKVDHEVHRLLPSLHGIANLLSEGMVTKTEELSELSTVLASIQHHISSADTCLDDVAGSSSTMQRMSHHFHTPNPRKRKHKSLLPPSPERRQKRKDSHAPL